MQVGDRAFMRTKDRIIRGVDRQTDRQTCSAAMDPFKSEVHSLLGEQAGTQCEVPRAIPRNNRAAEGVGSVGLQASAALPR